MSNDIDKNIIYGGDCAKEQSSGSRQECIITNPMLHDSGGKLIFGDNILCSQFLRDYGDMEILRHIRPEDLEDVSERYVPLYSAERNSDTVKRVDISKYIDLKENENPLNLPLFIISLVEHKTDVEYNVAMQVLRYTIHIWEDFEREMNRKFPGISARRDFRYPPILPIVYFEGKENWTASSDVADRIFCGKLLGQYLPHFRYQLVRLHDYSDASLLAKRDEISLAMLINKIQSPQDIQSFEELPEVTLNDILADTPEYLLEILAKLLRALFYSMKIPEEATEDAVARIKERKMGRLFEHQTVDFPKMMAEQQAMIAENQALEAEIRAMEAEQQKVAEENRKVTAENRTIEAENQKMRESMETARRITRRIVQLMRDGIPEAEIKQALEREFSLTKDEVDKYME